MNPLSQMITRGTFGEVFVQLSLLRFGVQAAPPIKDSGNDLIAIRGDTFRAIQVKSTAGRFPISVELAKLPPRYHLLALVRLDGVVMLDAVQFRVSLDSSEIFLIERQQVKSSFTEAELRPFAMTAERINELFPEPPLLVRQVKVTQVLGDPFAKKKSPRRGR
jgi:hypothetical protein